MRYIEALAFVRQQYPLPGAESLRSPSISVTRVTQLVETLERTGAASRPGAHPLLVHAAELSATIDPAADPPSRVAALEPLGYMLMKAGLHEQESRLWARLLEISRQGGPGATHRSGAFAFNLGMALWKAGHPTSALSSLELSLALLAAACSPEISPSSSGTPARLRVLDALTSLSAELNQLKQAKRYALRRITLTKAALGEQHPQVAHQLAELGRLHGALEEYEHALDRFGDALALWENSCGEKCEPVGIITIEIARILRTTGRIEGAEEQYRIGLEILEATLGRGAPLYAQGARELAGLLREDGREKEAWRLLEHLSPPPPGGD